MAAMDIFDEYFKQADLDHDGRISGAEAVAFFKRSNLPQNVLAQVGFSRSHFLICRLFLGRSDFFGVDEILMRVLY